MKHGKLIFSILIAIFVAIAVFAFKNDTKQKSAFDLDRHAEMAWRKLETVNKPPKGYLYPAKQNNKWGYINSKGKFIILPKYDYVTLFSYSGTAVVGNKEKGKKYISAKIINKNGKAVLKNIIIDKDCYFDGFPSSNDFFDNYFDVFKMKNGKYIIANQNGKIIYTTKKELGQYSEGFVSEGKSAYIDVCKLINGKSDFKIKLDKKYKWIDNFFHGYGELIVNDVKTKFVDKNGKIYSKEPKNYVNDINWSYESSYFNDNSHYRFYTFDNELTEDGYKILKSGKYYNKKFGLSTIDGKVLLPKKYYYNIKYLGEGMFAIELYSRYGEYHENECKLLFDAKSKKLHKVHYYMLQKYYNGVAEASDLKRSFFIDRNGKIAKGYPVFKQVGQLMRIGGLIMQNVHGRISYYLKDGTKIYSLDKDSSTMLRGSVGYIAVSTYRRYDFGIAYPRFFGLHNVAAQNRINDSAEKMNEEVFNSIAKSDEWDEYDVVSSGLKVNLNKNLLMVKYFVTTNGGGSMSMPYIYSKYYDIRTGESYAINSMFKKGTNYKKELVEKVAEIYTHKKLLGLLWGGYGDLKTIKEYLMDGNYYIAKDGIIISEFPDGSSNHLISYEELKIPYSKIRSIIDTNSVLWNSFKKTNN